MRPFTRATTQLCCSRSRECSTSLRRMFSKVFVDLNWLRKDQGRVKATCEIRENILIRKSIRCFGVMKGWSTRIDVLCLGHCWDLEG